MTSMLAKIVSGGQTGVDRAALDWAMAHQIAHGGWCPAGRMSEDGTIPLRYELTEMPDGGGYRQRTKANVQDSDGTLIISIAPELSGGSLATTKFADQLRKPCLHVHPGNNWKARLHDWLDRNPIRTLNVAGPRASKESAVAPFTLEVLDEVLKVLFTPSSNEIETEFLGFDAETESWIEAQRNPELARWLCRYALAFNTQEVGPLREALSHHVTYESQSVFNKITGRENLIHYLEGKLRVIRHGKNRVAAELAELPGGQPCVALYQAASEMDTNWLDTPLAAMTVCMNGQGLAESLLMITCAPAPSDAEGCGLFPGYAQPPTTRERRFIRSSPTFEGINLYFFYLDGEMSLDKAMSETAEYVRQHIEGIKVIEIIHSLIHLSWQHQKIFETFCFNGFPSVGAMFKGQTIYRQQGLMRGPELVEALNKAAPFHLASS